MKKAKLDSMFFLIFHLFGVDGFSQRLGKFQSCILVVLGGLLNVFQIYVLAKNA